MLAALLVSLSALTAPTCPLLQAGYTLRGAPEVTARFLPRTPTEGWRQDVIISIRSEKTGHAYRFLPALEGNGLGVKTHMEAVNAAGAVVSDEPSPLGSDNMYLVASQDYAFDMGWTASRSAPAPAHILIPGLQELFWYSDLQHRDGVPVAFLDLTSCGG
ncbi:MAG: hypothetical protein ACYDD1_13265 [Caulobacteraceae bacterium]